MAKVIEFYIPKNFRRPMKWVTELERERFSSILGVLLLMQWPVSGLWVIRLFAGIDLIFYGLAWIAIAVKLRNM